MGFCFARTIRSGRKSGTHLAMCIIRQPLLSNSSRTIFVIIYAGPILLYERRPYIKSMRLIPVRPHPDVH
ncbi:hypothetical protein BMS3Abin11_02250 [bacterium BMS3Abin11]|nr:hypothetical protein BMS3Abin11_02250 [bacterium BMS3Abin11]GMT39551.1 MAG: hypothetical protein IEMM0001_0286 [bacterium]